MKVTLKRITSGQDEAVICCHQVTREVESIVKFIEGSHKRITGYIDKEQFEIIPADVLYLESVDQKTFIYTKEKVYQSLDSLIRLEPLFSDTGFFRCSKSMILNIYKIKSLKSESGNRINATMENGEHVMISRRYARELRMVLKGEKA